MTGPKRVEVSGSTVLLYELDDPFPSRMTSEKAIALGRALVEAGEKAARNEGRTRQQPIDTRTED